MSVLWKNCLALCGLALSFVASAGSILPSGANLYPGQSIYSPGGKYYAIMQGDGNFVMYRSVDNAVRYASMKFGSVMAMQGDGNLVEYSSNWAPLWSTTTAGYPGAYMAVQDDGNLVIYSAGGTPLWNIGPDPSIDAPTNVGDVVARDLDYPVISIFGHLGMWTGSQVVEVVNRTGNAVRYVTWQSFSTTTRVWPTAKPNVPTFLVYYCFTSSCPWYDGTNYKTGIQARMALESRAKQIYLIGADYTYLATYVAAQPSYPGKSAVRGLYRCDTFIVDVFQATSGVNMNHSVPSAWQARMDSLGANPLTPSIVWNRLKN